MASVSHKTSHSDSPPTELPAPTVRLEMETAVRLMSTDEALATLEVVEIDLERGDLDDLAAFNARERKRALEAELGHRVRIFSMPESKAAKYAQDRESWADLARTIRETLPVQEVLHLIGYPATRTGHSRRSGASEYHSGCPRCADGTDRLVSFDGPESRFFCRKCDFRGDVITLTRSFMPGCSGFRDALKTLTRLTSMNVEAR